MRRVLLSLAVVLYGGSLAALVFFSLDAKESRDTVQIIERRIAVCTNPKSQACRDLLAESGRESQPIPGKRNRARVQKKARAKERANPRLSPRAPRSRPRTVRPEAQTQPAPRRQGTPQVRRPQRPTVRPKQTPSAPPAQSAPVAPEPTPQPRPLLPRAPVLPAPLPDVNPLLP